MGINYSIIIPHKNTPRLLQRCLDSIPRRDDIQIIVVDDNSDPGKVDFSNFPGEGSPNVEVYFPKEGRGAGYARNLGLTKSVGRWTLFADADDFYNPCLLDSIDKYEKSDFDIVYFCTNALDSDTLMPSRESEAKNALNQVSRMVHDALQTDDYEELRYRNYTSWAKLISSDLIKNHQLCFDETKANNDVMFNVQAAHFAGKVVADTSVIYCVTYHGGSLIMNFSEEACKARLYVNQRCNEFLQRVGKTQYRTNLFPFIISRDGFTLGGFGRRLSILHASYVFRWLLIDMFIHVGLLVKIFINPSQRKLWQDRRKMIESSK